TRSSHNHDYVRTQPQIEVSGLRPRVNCPETFQLKTSLRFLRRYFQTGGRIFYRRDHGECRRHRSLHPDNLFRAVALNHAKRSNDFYYSVRWRRRVSPHLLSPRLEYVAGDGPSDRRTAAKRKQSVPPA